MMIQYGLITEFRYTTETAGKKLEVKVSVDDRVTNWLPVKTQASSFLVVHTPVRISDQVIVFNPFGNNEDGFVDRNLTYKSVPLPDDADEDKYIQKFEDGTTYMHDIKTKEISLNTPCSVTLNIAKDVIVKSDKNITVECKSATVTADDVTIDSSKIDLGIGGMGVVTGECVCPFTGSPHADVSSTVKATK